MADDLKTTLQTIADMAGPLRRARVQSVTVDGVSFVLLPDEPEAVEVKPAKQAPPVDALNDPATYGWTEGRPGFVDPRKKVSP